VKKPSFPQWTLVQSHCTKFQLVTNFLGWKRRETCGGGGGTRPIRK